MQLHFMLPYETQWGQNVVISGARGLLGGGDVRKGIRMECTHEAVHGLVWQASMTVPSLYDFSYTYVVVNDREEPEVITAEAEQHHLSVPACSPGTTICVNDTFQVRHRPPPRGSCPLHVASRMLHKSCYGPVSTLWIASSLSLLVT